MYRSPSSAANIVTLLITEQAIWMFIVDSNDAFLSFKKVLEQKKKKRILSEAVFQEQLKEHAVFKKTASHVPKKKNSECTMLTPPP